MRAELQPVLKAAKGLPVEELPRLLGDLEEIRATATARLNSPPAPAAPDDWIEVQPAAEMLKHSESYLYHKWPRLPFAKKIGGRLLFSRAGIEKYLRH
jgi:hypothetical protein